MNTQQNPPPPIPQISTTETYLFECSRSNSIQDQSIATSDTGEENAIWSNKAGNFQIRKGDNISIEMAALNVPQTNNPMEFSGYNVILEGGVIKPYVDNRVILEIGYYIQNNQSYSCNLPLTFKEDINSIAGYNKITVNPEPSVLAAGGDNGIYSGIGMGFGHKFETYDGAGFKQFQTPNVDNESYLNSYRVFCVTGDDYVTPLISPVPAFTRIYSIVLEIPTDVAINHVQIAPIPLATPSSMTSFPQWCKWKTLGTTEGGYMSVGNSVNIVGDDEISYETKAVVCDIRASEVIEVAPPVPPYVNPNVTRVQVIFPKGVGGGFDLPISFTYGRAICFSTPNIRFNDLFRSQGMNNFNVEGVYSGVSKYTQPRQGSGLSDFFTNGIAGFVSGITLINIMTDVLNPCFPLTPEGMTFLKGGGIGSSNRQQGTDNIPYILTRNDFMGTQPKANGEQLGRYGTWCPDLAPLTSFIVLEASDLLMDASALAAKINETLHASLGTVGNNSETLASYETNIYGFTRRYKKSCQLLPFNQTAGYYPYQPYTQNDGQGNDDGFNTTYYNTQLWDSIDTYFTGGTKQIIPANIQAGFNKLGFIGFNNTLLIDMDLYSIPHVLGAVPEDFNGRQINGNAYPSFETTFLRTCKRPPDYYGDSCSWNNCIVGNRGMKNLYKELWGDIFNKIPVWSGNIPGNEGAGIAPAGARNFNRPVILNSALQNINVGGRLLQKEETALIEFYYPRTVFPTTVLVKNQMIFTNIYYNEAVLIAAEQKSPTFIEQPINGGITAILEKLVLRQRDYEMYINTDSNAPNTYAKQRSSDKMGYAVEMDLGMTNDFYTEKWQTTATNNISMLFNWDENPSAASAIGPGNPYGSFSGAGFERLCPTTTSSWFGSGVTWPQVTPAPADPSPHFDWNTNSNVSRPLGRILIQSRYDPDWLNTSNLGGQIPYPDGTYPQFVESADLSPYETVCSFKDANGLPHHSDTWSKDNDMGIYPYEYTDNNGKKYIFMCFRVAQDYKPANTQIINSEIVNTWRIGQFTWGSPFGFSSSNFDNYGVVPMNPDDKLIGTPTVTQKWNAGADTKVFDVNFALIENTNGYIAVGANNPTFTYNPDKSRMEITQTYQSTQLSPYNTNNNTDIMAAVDTPNLGEKVAIFNDKCPDAVYSPTGTFSDISGGGTELNDKQRSEESGIFIYKIWLPNENWNVPTDINLYSYWSNNSPDNQRFETPLQPPPNPAEPWLADYRPNYTILETEGANQTQPDTYQYRNNQDNTENNRDTILENLTEATNEYYAGCLLDKLGFTLEQFKPIAGNQWVRYSINGYNNPQPDLQRIQNTKPLILGNQSNITLNDAFNVNYIPPVVPPPVPAPISGLPNYGLGFSNNLPVVTNSTDIELTAINPIESTNSPFYQIYSNICQNHYIDNGIAKSIMFYVMKNYVSSNYSYGYGSTFSHTATKNYNLDTISTEIRNPISGRLMRVLQPNSVITYKIVRPITLAPDTYDEISGLPLVEGTAPLAPPLTYTAAELFNIVPSDESPQIAPETQVPVYMFNNNNALVNLNTAEAVNWQEASAKVDYEGIGDIIEVSPLNQDVVVQGVIAAEEGETKGEQTLRETKVADDAQQIRQEHDETGPAGILYDWLTHAFLNEVIPASKSQFTDEESATRILTLGLDSIGEHARETINRLAEEVTRGLPIASALVQLGNFIFQGDDVTDRFLINQRGQKINSPSQYTGATDRYHYEISNEASQEISETLRRNGGLSEIRDDVTKAIRNADLALVERRNDDSRDEGGSNITSESFVHSQEGLKSHRDLTRRRGGIYGEGHVGRGVKDREIERGNTLGAAFNAEDYVRALGRGENLQYAGASGGDIGEGDINHPPEQDLLAKIALHDRGVNAPSELAHYDLPENTKYEKAAATEVDKYHRRIGVRARRDKTKQSIAKARGEGERRVCKW